MRIRHYFPRCQAERAAGKLILATTIAFFLASTAPDLKAGEEDPSEDQAGSFSDTESESSASEDSSKDETAEELSRDQLIKQRAGELAMPEYLTLHQEKGHGSAKACF